MPSSTPELEIKDARVIFEQVWEKLSNEFDADELCFPKELILLGGAPGSGKGTQTRFISESRGLSCPPIVVSSLLDSPEARKIKDEGGMVGDAEVMGIVFRELLKEPYRDGVILDGFPRTKVQVECIKLLSNKMEELWRSHQGTALARFFRKPVIHVVILFIDEKTSVLRQLGRGKQIEEHNKEVEETGVGTIIPLRKTDLDNDSARHRYRVFKEQTWDALNSLKEVFYYHFINAQGSIKEVEKNILRELHYQSSLELDPITYSALREIPVADDIVLHARQELVHRLDKYAIDQPELFRDVVTFMQERMVPVVMRHAITGMAIINSETELLHNPNAIAMLIDVFSERGYHAVVDIHQIEVPEFVDLQTGSIRCRTKRVYRIQVRFNGSEIRRG